MNSFTAIGRLTRDAATEETKTGTKVASFRLAVDGPNKTTHFLPVKVYGKYAESISDYLTQGRQIGLTGRIQHNTWTTQEGDNRERLEVVANSIDFLSKPKSNTSSQEEAPADAGAF